MVSCTWQDKLGLKAGEIRISTESNKDVDRHERLSTLTDRHKLKHERLSTLTDRHKLKHERLSTLPDRHKLKQSNRAFIFVLLFYIIQSQ